MAFDLCEEDEYVVRAGQREQWFSTREGILCQLFGETREAEARVFTVGAVMERRANSSKEGWNSYFDTASSFVYPSASGLPLREQKFKVCPYSSRLAQIGQDSLIVFGGLMIPSYDDIKAVEFTRGEVILERGLNEREASEHSVLLEYFEGNRELLGKCVQGIFKKWRDEYGYTTMMGIYLAEEQREPHERAACVDELENRSRFYGGYRLVGYGRLVGVASEALGLVRERYPNLYRLLRVDEQRAALVGGSMNLESVEARKYVSQAKVVPTPAPIFDTMGIEISDVYVKMPTEAEQRREDLRRMIENVHMDEETYLKLRKELEGNK